MELLSLWERYEGRDPYTNDFLQTHRSQVETEARGILSDLVRYPDRLTRATMIVFFVANAFYSTISGITLVSAINLVFEIKKYIEVCISPIVQTKESYELHTKVILLAVICVLRPDLIAQQ